MCMSDSEKLKMDTLNKFMQRMQKAIKMNTVWSTIQMYTSWKNSDLDYLKNPDNLIDPRSKPYI